jgi:hypothetical protein
MRENSRPTLSVTRRLTAALFGIWLGVSCLFCCDSAMQASAVYASAADYDARQAVSVAEDGSCCRAHLKRGEKSGAGEASHARIRPGQLVTGRGAFCISCSHQAADSARRARVLPLPALAPDYEGVLAFLPVAADGVGYVGSLILNRSGTYLRCCVLLI